MSVYNDPRDHREGLVFANPRAKFYRRQVELKVSPELLVEVLMMPEGTRIVDVAMDPWRGSLNFLLHHPLLPETEDNTYPRGVTPVYSVTYGTDPHRFTADWGPLFPKEEEGETP